MYRDPDFDPHFENAPRELLMQEAHREEARAYGAQEIHDLGECQCCNGWRLSSRDAWLPCPYCPQGMHPEYEGYMDEQAEVYAEMLRDKLAETLDRYVKAGPQKDSWALVPQDRDNPYKMVEDGEDGTKVEMLVTAIQFDVRPDSQLEVSIFYIDPSLGNEQAKILTPISIQSMRATWRIWEKRGYEQVLFRGR